MTDPIGAMRRSTYRELFGLTLLAVAVGVVALLLGRSHDSEPVRAALGSGGHWSFYQYEDASAQSAASPVPPFIVLFRGTIDGGGSGGITTTSGAVPEVRWTFESGALLSNGRSFDLRNSNVLLIDRAGALQDLERLLSTENLRALRAQISDESPPGWLDDAWDAFWDETSPDRSTPPKPADRNR
ncbi:MAG: hypothetical protein AAF488_01700 [Planctomycetota bacterium]